MGVVSMQEEGVASGSGWNLWVWLLGAVVRRYIYIFPHTTYPYSSCICSFSSITTFCSFKKMFFVLVPVFFVITFYVLNMWLVGVGGIYGCGYWVWL